MNETTTETSSPVVDSSEGIESTEVFTEEVTTVPVTEEIEATETVYADNTDFSDFLAIYTANEEGFYKSFEEFLIENRDNFEIYCSQASELNSYAAVVAENTTAIKAQTETEVILLFAVIAFLGMVCGLLIANCIRK